MWFDGIQWLVHLLQELEENGSLDDSVCSKIIVPGGESVSYALSFADLIDIFL